MKNTRIELEYPYNKDFKSGYLNINKEPRRVLLLVRNNGTKTSTAYARYLMAVSVGRYLEKTEHVDHKDNNKLNDVIDNLQILTPKENNIKKNEHLNIKETIHKLICPICNEIFYRTAQRFKNEMQSCSKKCGYIKTSNTFKNK